MQEYIDNAISSTVNLSNAATVEDVENIYMKAWELGLKGITVFRNGCKRASILGTDDKKKEEEITEAEKEDMTNTNKKIADLREDINKILSEYAASNKKVSQLIDLALLSNGMLKGEALSNFIKRSVQLIH